MKSYPLILTAAEVRAVLNGTKTQHRVRVVVPRDMKDRIVRFDKAWADPGFGGYGYLKLPNRHRTDRDSPVEEWPVNRIYCPLADDIGSTLWVRETFAECGGQVVYRADCPDGFYPGANFQPWRPPLAMPRRLSRITLVVESVRVERVHDIGEEDARAEGARFHDGHDVGHSGWRIDDRDVHPDAYSAYGRLWIEKYGRASWDANPWVFALTFKRQEAAR